MKSFTPKALVGALIVVVTFALIDVVSGGLFGGASSTTNIQVTVSLCNNDQHIDGRAFRVRFDLRNPDDVRLTVSAFDQIMNPSTRRRLIESCESMWIRMNFRPTSVTLKGRNRNLTGSVESCREGEYCLKFDQALLRESSGHVDIRTGLGLSATSLSSAVVKLGVISGTPDTSVEARADLLEGWLPHSPLPEPSHVSYFAQTRLVWKADSDQGISAPDEHHGGRSIRPTIGILLPVQNAQLKTVETTLLFFLSALFGVGFTLIAEWAISFVPSQKSEPAVQNENSSE